MGCTLALGVHLQLTPINYAPPNKNYFSRPGGPPAPLHPSGYAHACFALHDDQWRRVLSAEVVRAALLAAPVEMCGSTISAVPVVDDAYPLPVSHPRRRCYRLTAEAHNSTVWRRSLLGVNLPTTTPPLPANFWCTYVM